MELKKYFLEQLNREAAASRKVLERVPEGQNSWKPHERSMELGYLAALVATMPGWLALMIERDELNLDDPAGRTFRTQAVATRAELLRLLDEGLAKSTTALNTATEEHFMKPWRIVLNGRVLGEGLRYAMIADSALAHMAHHRGQLTVYLRLNEAKVPALYGPSADERI
ncbi:MAG TPA: DinB family protein [Bryobacteraceae bacterium]|nr:DinB family protein [Bryobacteraceae bacterium]